MTALGTLLLYLHPSRCTGSLVSMLAALQKESAFVAEQMEKVERFIRSRRIGKGLATRMRTYYHYALMNSTDSDDISLITGLSYSLRYVSWACAHCIRPCLEFWHLNTRTSLVDSFWTGGTIWCLQCHIIYIWSTHGQLECRCECVLHIFQDILPCVPILCGRPQAFAIQLVSVMILAVFAPEDVIVKQGSLSDTLYIMVEGPAVSAEVCAFIHSRCVFFRSA